MTKRLSRGALCTTTPRCPLPGSHRGSMRHARLWVARVLGGAPYGARAPRRRCRHSPAALPPPLPAAPLGLYGFALTTALLQGSKTQLTEPKGTAQVAVSFGFFFGGLAQFCAGLLEYQRRNTFGTVAFCW